METVITNSGTSTIQSGRASSDGLSGVTTQVHPSTSSLQSINVSPVVAKAIVYSHLELMKEKNITMSGFPKNLRQKEAMWKTLGAKKNKGEKLMDTLKRESIVIANEMQNFLEKDLPEKSEEEIQSHVKEKEKADIDKARAEAERKRIIEARNRIPELTPEQKQEKLIFESLDENGKIHYRELTNILGRSIGLRPVRVGSIVLHNEYMTNYYYIHEGG